MEANAPIVEIMESVQGEGPYVGCRQIFIRFAGCNLNCSYCDTIGSKEADLQLCRIEEPWGSQRFQYCSNPITVSEIITKLHKRSQNIHSLSLTGGEPLLSANFIIELAQAWGSNRPPFYLETNGTLVTAMEKVHHCIDYVSMDIKLPTLTGHCCWEEHGQFLECIHNKKGYVKVVVGQETTMEEISIASSLIQQKAPTFPLVLQPISDSLGKTNLSAQQLYQYQSWALQEHDDVRIVPQIHRLLSFL
ncbi:7-carboxy-7-deazaguanine synthase QueE [Heliorestis convoluta]|nr:7-carboxy-7-deazaguanine synthase QueE [Heliorestis convoluta]